MKVNLRYCSGILTILFLCNHSVSAQILFKNVDFESLYPYAGIYFLSSLVAFWIFKKTTRCFERILYSRSQNGDDFYNFQQKPVEEGEDVVYGFPISQHGIGQTLKEQSELEEIAEGNPDICFEILASMNPLSEFATIVENKEQEEIEDLMGIYSNVMHSQKINAYSSKLKSIPNEVLDQFKKQK